MELKDKKYVDILPVRDSNNNLHYSKSYNTEAINNSIKNLFNLELGEVPGKPWLGNPLSIYLFDNIGYFEQRSIEISIRNTLELYEPRISVDYVYITNLKEYNTLEINIGYYIVIDGQRIFEDLKFKHSHNNITSIKTRNT